MLGKLIKYDLKYASKIFLLIHGIYLLACILLRLIFMNHIDFNASPEQFVTPVTLIIVIIVFMISAVGLTTSLLIALRFYRNLFGQEGYLTWTLPASSSEHLLAKFLSGYLLAALDVAVISAGILLLVTGPNVTEAYSHIAPEIRELLGISLGSYALKIFIFSLFFSFTTVVQIYFCIALGQLFQGHRVLFAIAFYLLTGFIMQLLVTLLLFITGLFTDQFTDAAALSANMGTYTEKVYLLTGLLSAAAAVIEYIAAHYIMKRKINLI